jgi:hypothetical protein
MSQKVYAGSLALTKMKSAIITTKKGNKAILMPIDDNYFTEKDGAVYLNVSVIVRDEQDQYGQNGFISQKLPTDKYKELGSEKGKEIGNSLPILGNIKHFENANSQNDSFGTVKVQGQVNPEDSDDIPF